MRVLLIQFDGKFPNLALMRISTHHKERGDSVELRHLGSIEALDRTGLELFAWEAADYRPEKLDLIRDLHPLPPNTAPEEK